MDELSKVKRDLEAALKDVLQVMRLNQETPSSISIPSLEALANVSVSCVAKLLLAELFFAVLILAF